ncbi:MAG: hypothetical protein NTW29_22700 [Bacteroidetes bacterium]|nr:hypothetical protein [Bacteroidota bacterium]
MEIIRRLIGIFKRRPKIKNWPHDILDYLLREYTEVPTYLNTFLYNELKLGKKDNRVKDKIKEILDLLRDKEYITWVAYSYWIDENGNPHTKDDVTYDFHTKPGMVLNDVRIEAHLTIDGLEHAIELRRDRQKHSYFLFVTPFSILLSLSALGLSIWTTFIKPKEKPTIQKIELTASDTIPIQPIQRMPQNGHTLLPNFDTSSKD